MHSARELADAIAAILAGDVPIALSECGRRARAKVPPVCSASASCNGVAMRIGPMLC